jgi:hypothetical protein
MRDTIVCQLELGEIGELKLRVGNTVIHPSWPLIYYLRQEMMKEYRDHSYNVNQDIHDAVKLIDDSVMGDLKFEAFLKKSVVKFDSL